MKNLYFASIISFQILILTGLINSLAIGEENDHEFVARALTARNLREDTGPKPYPPNTTICFEYEGCFSNKYPFDNAGNFLPTSPEILATEFLLFNDKNSNKEESLSFKNTSIIKNSSFDPNLPLKLLIHGFSNNRSTPWLNKLKDEILSADMVNVVIVAWGNGSRFPYYPNSTANTRLVGKQTGMLVNAIRSVFFESNPKKLNIHCIGHSLGAHTCGYASNAAKIAFNRITALDPAGPNFEDGEYAVRVDPSDAYFVDAIHTNGNAAGILSGSFGILMSSGHVDFFINGGFFQPSCPGITGIIGGAISGQIDPAREIGCSHNRAQILFMESIKTSCPFVAFSCPSSAMFERGECSSCNDNKCSVFGYFADKYKGRGTMFLSTNQSPPYCGYHHFFELTINENSQKTAGDIYLNINSESIKILNGDEIKPKTSIKKMFITSHDLVYVDEIQMNFTKKSTWFGLFSNPDTFVFDKIKLTNLEADEIYSSCKKNTELRTNTSLAIQINDEDCTLN